MNNNTFFIKKVKRNLIINENYKRKESQTQTQL